MYNKYASINLIELDSFNLILTLKVNNAYLFVIYFPWKRKRKRKKMNIFYCQ